ncbi:MAG: VanZ family protein [Salinibacterium sp.]|nr:VanZ family protein [Salinibacterium sp.]
MRAKRYILTGIAAIYFGALVGLTFVRGPAFDRGLWVWPFVAFLPVGILLVLLLGRRRWWAAVAFAVLGSAWIEAAQSIWMPVGYAQAIDIAWASLGAVAGIAATVAVINSRRYAARPHGSPRIVTHAGHREIPQD